MPFMWKTLRIAVGVSVLGIATTLLLVHKPWERVATIPAGTTIVAALEEDVSQEDSRVGDEIELRTVGSIHLANGAEVPEGSELTGEVTKVYGGRKYPGPSEVGMRFTDLEIVGKEYTISTEQYLYATLGVPAQSGEQVVFSAGQQLTIRLSRPVAVRSRPVSDAAVAARR
ncbi:MAG: hypothetical protein ACREMW_15140 [Gemmatimonadales bacterium]